MQAPAAVFQEAGAQATMSVCLDPRVHAPASLEAHNKRASVPQYNPVLGETHFITAGGAWMLVEQARSC